jgi:TPP-dependent pyruvate/acetoin dehydrogenase alpha subunit
MVSAVDRIPRFVYATLDIATMSGLRASMDPVLSRLYASALKIRRVEEAIARIYPSDKIKSPVHLSIGQEAVAVGVIDFLSAEDVVAGTYRGHASYLAKGGSLPAMFAELYGKATGCAGGKGGSMHLIGMDKNILGCSAVVGSHIPVAAGYALAIRARREKAIVACFLGDGATEEGVFSESLNFAALRTLPILFVCENNGFAIHEPLSKRWASNQLVERVRTYGIRAERIESGDIFAIRAAAGPLVDYVRSGQGPAFIECPTVRWKEHVGPNEDFDVGYRARPPAEVWPAQDPVVQLGARLTEDDRRRIEDEIDAEIAAAVDFAERSPVPDVREVYTNVFAA